MMLASFVQTKKKQDEILARIKQEWEEIVAAYLEAVPESIRPYLTKRFFDFILKEGYCALSFVQGDIKGKIIFHPFNDFFGRNTSFKNLQQCEAAIRQIQSCWSGSVNVEFRYKEHTYEGRVVKTLIATLTAI